MLSPKKTPSVPCVPVSTAGERSSRQGSNPGPIGFNKLHEARCITSLVEYYGWTLCADGNLYNPYPGSGLEGSDAK